MRRPDPGEAATDKIIAEIEKRIAKEYKQAEREIAKKLNDYQRRFDAKDKIWQRWVLEDKKKESEYQQWRIGQIAMGKRWEEMKDTISEDLLNVSKIAKSIATEYMPEVYALNHDFGTFQVEKKSLVDTSYTLYSREAAERLFRDNPDLLPKPGKTISRKIAEGKALKWNKNNVQSVMMQAILQGNSIPDIATRLHNALGATFTEEDIKNRDKKTAEQVAKELVRKNRQAAVRNARTMATAAQNAGRVDSYKRANNMGIPVKKQWLATLDMRTRHEHRVLDGQVQDEDKPFEVDSMKIMFPGDPDAPGRLVWNCFVGETEVATDSEIVRSYKHEFHGDLIRIRTSTGIDFTCTPNHPILTPSGWVPAARFNKGDNLLITRVGNSGGVTVNGNVYHVHSSIQAIHDSFHEFGIANNTPMTNFNFHGDIPTSDVEVISKKRLLRIDGNTGIFKGFNKTFFKNADTLIFSKCHFVKCLRRINVSAFGLMSRSRKFLSFFWRCLSHAKVHRFGTVTGSNVSVSEYPINNLPATTVIRSELLNGLTGSVFLDNVIAVNKCSGSSTRHVYNLQTENGYYFVTKGVPQAEQKSNDNYGVIVKNCRCTLIPAIEGHVSDLSDISQRNAKKLEGMSYEEWKKDKEPKTNPILLPEEKADNIRASYIREYRGYGGAVASGRDTTLNIDNDLTKSLSPGQSANQSYKTATGALPLEETMSKTAYGQYAKQLRDAGDDIANLHDLYDYQVGFVNVDVQKAGDAHYDRANGIVSYSLSRLGTENRFRSLNHECGHMFDHKMDGGIEGLTFDEFVSIRDIIGWGEESQPVMPSRSDEFMQAMRRDIERLWDIVSAPNWDALNDELLSDDSSAGVQDLLDGVFGRTGEVRIKWGHGNSYYDRMYENVRKNGDIEDITHRLDINEDDLRDMLREYEISSELWANINSALTVGGNAEKFIRMYAPDAVRAFLSIIKRAK